MRLDGTVLVMGLAWLGLAGTGRSEGLDRTGLAQAAQAAGQRAAQGIGAPTIQVYSRETVVDVVVTDDDGKPVCGLTQADFTVKEDGKPKTIRSFKEFGGAAPAGPVRPKLPPGVYSNVGATPQSGPVNIIMLDALETNPEDMTYVKWGALEYLKSMPAGTQVALFALSVNKGARLLQTFTSDVSVAAAVVEHLDVEWVARPNYMIEFDRMERDADDLIAAYVAGIEGRKNLIWFTGHFPRVTNALVAARIALYPVDATALKSRMKPIGVSAVNKPDLEYVRGHQDIPDLEGAAEATGGVAFYNSNDLATPIGKAIEHGSHYYTLTYVPPKYADDGRFHTIDIKVDQPGVHLNYRKGFRVADVVPAILAPGPKLMQAAMGGGAPPATQVLFDVQVKPSTVERRSTDPAVMGTLNAKFAKAPLVRYGFLYMLPMSQIGFAEGKDGMHRGSLEFDVAVYNADGKMVTMLSQTMQLPLTTEEYEQFVKTPFQFMQQVDLPPGKMTVRVGVLDAVSNKVGTMEIPLTIESGSAVAGR
jgi:VWFA-related protein